MNDNVISFESLGDFAITLERSPEFYDKAHELSAFIGCERCGGLARIVHHRIYITPRNIGDPSITLDWANLEALCMECHNIEHTCVSPLADGLYFDRDGNPVPIPPGSRA